MISISKACFDEIYKHATSSYPNECCGLLVGRSEAWRAGDKRTVVKVYASENTIKGRPEDRYEISSADINRIDKEARGEGLDIIGFYHSHPDHPDRPSEFDRERAQPGYSYLIISVTGRGKIAVKSWTFNEPEKPFSEEEVEFT